MSHRSEADARINKLVGGYTYDVAAARVTARGLGVQALLGTDGRIHTTAPVPCAGCGKPGIWLVDEVSAWCPRCGG